MRDGHQDIEQQAEGMAVSDFSTIVNAFTEGLRELPADYATRVKNFLAEYLGSAHHPIPFGGRAKDFESLDSWLADQDAPPYLLLAAPAGRGKSALLLRWRQRLLNWSNLAAVYFPVSIRFRTNLAGVVFPSLVALLAHLHSEKVPADPNMHEEVWRGLLVDYMTRPLPDGRSLVLILDGVDEAADWAPGPGLFPQDPPAGLRVVLSARYLANDRDADAWLERLGWTRKGLAHTLQLYPLDRIGIASVLIQMGFPLDLLGTRVNIVSELHRLSEGDPLLVRLYVDDLWERGEAAVRLSPEDLRSIRPGLVGYFERWWKDQRVLWSEQAPKREVAAQTLLNLLAGALGPLSKQDILSLAPDEAGFGAGGLEQHLASLSRFVIGDGMRQGYVFSHPRLANYFLEERLSEVERQEVERRFLAWGEQTLTALDAGRLAPEKASAYIVQYYGAHLERAQASATEGSRQDAHALLSLVSDGWRRAWEKLDRANAGFLGDVERAWRAAGREDLAAASDGQEVPYLGEEIRCLLCRVSVNSVTSNISPRLMLEAVKTGIWTPAQGLACIRLIADLAPRARELVGLAPYVQEPLRTDIMQEALDTVMTIKDEYARLDALVELAPGLSEELLWQVLDVVPAIEDEADRAGVLAELTPALAHSSDQLERALNLVQEIDEEEYRALALEGLAPGFSEDQHGRVLQLMRRIREERYRAQTLAALIPYLSENLLYDALQETRGIEDGVSRVRLLPELATYLPDRSKTEVVQETLELMQNIDDREYRVEVLVRLAPFLSEARLHEALHEVELIWDESFRTQALSHLTRYMPEEHLPELLRVVLVMKSEEYRTQALLQLLPRLPETLLGQVLDNVQATWDEGCRVEILAKLAPYAPEALLPSLLAMAQAIKDHGYRVWLLAELEAPLTGKLRGRHLDMLTSFLAIKEQEERLHTLLAIVPRLSEEALSKIFNATLPDVFGFRWHFQPEERRADILAKLVSRLPEAWLDRVMEMVRAMSNEVYQVQVLVALAPRIGETLLSEALDIVRAMKDREKRAQVLEVLVSSLPEERKGERVQEMLQVLQVIKDEADRTRMVGECTDYLPETLPTKRTRVVIEAVRAMWFETNQAHVLKALVSHMSEDMFGEVLAVVQAMESEEERAQMLETLAIHVPEYLLPLFLRAVQAILSERWRTQVLATVVSHAPKEMFVGILGMAQAMQDEYERAQALGALAPNAPEGSFPQLWEAMQTIRDEGRRVWVLGTLAVRVPENFFSQFWEAVQTIRDEGWQMQVLGALAPHVSESLFARLWGAMQETLNSGRRARVMKVLAPYVPERFFLPFWKAIQMIPDERTRIEVLEALAPRVPERFMLWYLPTVRAIADEGRRAQVLEALVPHLPEGLFSQLWDAVQEIQGRMQRAKMLEVLAPRVPEEFFSPFLRAAQTIPLETQQAKVLEAFAPRIPEHFFPTFWAAVRAMNNKMRQAYILKALIPHLPGKRLADVRRMIQDLPYGELRIELLEALVPHLSQEQCVEMLEALAPLQRGEGFTQEQAATQAAWDTRWHMREIAVLVPRLPEKRLLAILPAVLKAVQRMRTEEDRVLVLTKLASNIPGELLKEMLEVLWSIDMEHHRMQVLATLLPTLSESGWARMIELATVKMRETGDTHFLLQVLKAARSFVKQLSPSLLYPVIREVLHLLAQRTRRDALADLAPLLPTIQALDGQEAVTEAVCATLEVGCWWP